MPWFSCIIWAGECSLLHLFATMAHWNRNINHIPKDYNHAQFLIISKWKTTKIFSFLDQGKVLIIANSQKILYSYCLSYLLQIIKQNYCDRATCVWNKQNIWLLILFSFNFLEIWWTPRTVVFWYEISQKYFTIFSSLSIVITTKDYTKDLKGSYYNLDVPKLKILPSKCADFVFKFGQFCII